MQKTQTTERLRQAYVSHNGAEVVYFGLVDTDGEILRAVYMTLEEFVEWTEPSVTSRHQESIKILIDKRDVFDFLQLHAGRVEYAGTLSAMRNYPGRNDGEKFEAYTIARLGWAAAPRSAAWYESGDAIDATGRQIQIGFNGKTVCHTGHLETLGLK